MSHVLDIRFNSFWTDGVVSDDNGSSSPSSSAALSGKRQQWTVVFATIERRAGMYCSLFADWRPLWMMAVPWPSLLARWRARADNVLKYTQW